MGTRSEGLTTGLSLFLASFLCGRVSLCAQDQGTKTNDFVIELYMRSDKEQSNDARKFLEELVDRRPGLKIKTYDVTEDKEALARLGELSKKFGYDKPAVPAFHFGDSLKLGFSEEYTAPLIKNYLTIRAFVRQGCPHCSDAEQFLDKMVKRWPGLNVEYYDVLADADGRAELQKVANKYRVRVDTFPCIEVAGRVIIGYQTDAVTGRNIEGFFKDHSFQEIAEPRVSSTTIDPKK